MPSLTSRQARALGTRRASRPPRVRPEREVVREVLAYLRTIPGVTAWRCNTGMAMLPGRGGKPMPVRFGVKGMADIVGWKTEAIYVERIGKIHRARFLAIECKREGQEPTVLQAQFLQSVQDAGGIGIVAHGVEDVVKALERP